MQSSIQTGSGIITVSFLEKDAPKTVENFLKLASSGFYEGVLFHRIVPGFVIQGGDPLTKDPKTRQRWGTGGPGWNVKAEFNKNKHVRGALSMARSQDINSAGSQFFIVLKNAASLDGNYTVFGNVVSGMDVVDKIASLKTDDRDCPQDLEKARITKVTVQN